MLPPPSSAAESGWRGEMVMVQPNAAQLQEIAKLLNAGEIRIVVEQVLPLNQIRQALALIQRE